MYKQVYERAAIEDWFARTHAFNSKVKSPATNQIIGKQLVTASRVKNMIEKVRGVCPYVLACSVHISCVRACMQSVYAFRWSKAVL